MINDDQDRSAQRNALRGLGVTPQRVDVDHGLTGRNKQRPGVGEALAACRARDTLVVTKTRPPGSFCSTHTTSRTTC
ncbi:recombinase family protein [Brevibacterium sp. UMB10442]|nr:recombinase family protein [Brevibacterium sp. UMB10442]